MGIWTPVIWEFLKMCNSNGKLLPWTGGFQFSSSQETL